MSYESCSKLRSSNVTRVICGDDRPCGWMLPELIAHETNLWGRWNHWKRIRESIKFDYSASDFGNIKHPSAPRIHWSEDLTLPKQMIYECLDAIADNGPDGWKTFDWLDHIETLVDWILYGMGKISYSQAEPELDRRLYEIFNLKLLLEVPGDHLGEILEEMNYFPASDPTKQFTDGYASIERYTKILKNRDNPFKDPESFLIVKPCSTGRPLMALYEQLPMSMVGVVSDDSVTPRIALVNAYLFAPSAIYPLIPVMTGIYKKKSVHANSPGPDQFPQNYYPLHDSTFSIVLQSHD